MVKKRRKILPQDLKKTNNSEGTTDDKGNKIETDSINKTAEGRDVKDEPIQSESGISEGYNNITDNEIEIKSENEESTEKQDQQDEDTIRYDYDKITCFFTFILYVKNVAFQNKCEKLHV